LDSILAAFRHFLLSTDRTKFQNNRNGPTPRVDLEDPTDPSPMIGGGRGAHYGPGRGGGGGGRWNKRKQQPQSADALRVTMHLDESKRGFVIGAQGAVVKQTQTTTGARISTPKRGVDGPTVITGPDAISVLRACCMIARQTSAMSECTCSVAGSAELRATLFPTDAVAHRLFETDSGTAMPFTAYVLPATSAASPKAEQLQSRIDDASFAAGTSNMPAWALRAGQELFVFGMGPGSSVASSIYSQLAAELTSTLATATAGVDAPTAPAAELVVAKNVIQDGGWHRVLLTGGLASGGDQHEIVAAALHGKLGLGPAAKELNRQVPAGGELYWVDDSLLAQIDTINSMAGRTRQEASVDEGDGLRARAWVYESSA